MNRKILPALSMCLFASSAAAGDHIQIDAAEFRYIVYVMRKHDRCKAAQVPKCASQLAAAVPCEQIAEDLEPSFSEIFHALSLANGSDKFNKLVVELAKLPYPDLLDWYDETANLVALAISGQKAYFCAYDNTSGKCYLTYAALNYIDSCLSLYERPDGNTRTLQHQRAVAQLLALRALPDETQSFLYLVPAIMHMKLSRIGLLPLEYAIFQELLSRGHYAL